MTGAAGFLGNTIVRMLVDAGEQVRAGVHSNPDPASLAGVDAQRVRVDVTSPASVRNAIIGGDPERARRTVVVHAAGMVSIADKVSPQMRKINVSGTRNVIEACQDGAVARLIHVSSVHAVAPNDAGVIVEPDHYDPDLLHGAYAKTKAAASQLVKQASDLDRVIVHPSGLIGPGDYGDTALTRLIRDLAANKLPTIIKGGYDFVDVRDVAAAIIAAADRGRNGEAYLLGGGWLSIAEIAEIVSAITGARRPVVLPIALARLAVPIAALSARLRGTAQVFTNSSLDVVASNETVSAAKAQAELGFEARPVAESIRDMVMWLRAQPSA